MAFATKALGILMLVGSLALTAPHGVAGDTSECVGDCGQDGEVTVDELLKMVNIALGSTDLPDCLAGDQNGDGSITIDEILRAVNNALTGCPLAGATATPTPTPTPTSGSSTSAVAGRSVVVVDTLSTISQIVAAIVNGIQVSGGLGLAADVAADLTNGGGAGTCPLGGTATKTGGLFNKDITLTGCKVETSDGSVTFDGTISIQVLSLSFNLNVDAVFADQLGTETLQAHATLAGTISPALGGSCYLTAATFTLNSGSLMTTRGGVTVGVTFQNTTMTITNITFNTSCSPTKYLLTFDGPAVLIDRMGMLTNVAFNALTMDVDDSSSQTVLVVGGGMTSACFGGPVTLMTSPALSVARGENCPDAGTIVIGAQGQTVGRTVFNPDQSVGLDLDGNGSIDETVPNCLDPRLLICAA